MYRRIEDFLHNWEYEAASTSKIIGALTDASLQQPVSAGHRTLPGGFARPRDQVFAVIS